MIRTSDLGQMPQKQVTAQRYQAEVTPAAPQESVVDKLLAFGGKAVQAKHVWDGEIFQADMKMASENFEANIKSIPPEEFVKDPDAAMEKAGYSKMTEVLGKAPPGTQKLYGRQLENIKQTTTATMQATHAKAQHTKAVIFNATTAMRETGNIPQEYMDQLHTLDPKQQQHFYNVIGQEAVLQGKPQLMDQLIADPNTPIESQDYLLQIKRQAQEREEAKRREDEREARAVAREQRQMQKEMQVQLANNAAVELVLKGHTPDYAAAQTGAKVSDVNKAIYQNPQYRQQARAVSVLAPDRAEINSGFANPRDADTKQPTGAFTNTVGLVQAYLKERGNDPDKLKGVLLNEGQATMVKMALAESESSGGDFGTALHRIILSTPMLPEPTSSERKELKALTDGKTTSQMMRIQDGYNFRRARGQEHSAALKEVGEDSEKNSRNFDGLLVDNVAAVENTIAQGLGHKPDDGVIGIILEDALKVKLGKVSAIRFGGVNQPLSSFVQRGSLGNGDLYFQHNDGGPYEFLAQKDIHEATERYSKRLNQSPTGDVIPFEAKFQKAGPGFVVNN